MTGAEAARAEHRYLLPLLMGAMIVHQIDRNAINVVIEPMKREFGFTDGQLGLLAGTLYAASYIAAGPPIGWLADRLNRRNLLATLMTAWSLLTALSAFAQSYAGLALARLGVGAAESGNQPASLSMISDVYPPEKRGSVSGLIYGAAGIGVFISLLAGGFVAAHWGWRAVFLIASLPGFIVALLLILLVKEPRRQHAHHAAPQSPLSAGASLLFHPVLACIYLGAGSYTMIASATGTWAISILIRTHGYDLASAGVIAAVATGLGITIGSIASGRISDWAGRSRPGNAIGIASLTAVLYAFAAIGFATTRDARLALLALFLVGLLAQAHAGPALGMVSRIAPAHLRGLAFSLFSVVGSTLGLAFGPVIAGLLSDWFGGADSLARSVIALAPLMVVPALLFFLAARRVNAGRAPWVAQLSTSGEGQNA